MTDVVIGNVELLPLPGERPIDPECLDLVAALNELPGLCTIASCSGHGVRKFWIGFDVDSVDDAAPVDWAALCGGGTDQHGYAAWGVRISWGEKGSSQYTFVLEGPAGDYEGAARVAQCVRTIIREGIAKCKSTHDAYWRRRAREDGIEP